MAGLSDYVSLKRWDVVECLLELNNDIKIPLSDLIFALKEAAKAKQWEIVNVILHLQIKEQGILLKEGLKIAIELKQTGRIREIIRILVNGPELYFIEAYFALKEWVGISDLEPFEPIGTIIKMEMLPLLLSIHTEKLDRLRILATLFGLLKGVYMEAVILNAVATEHYSLIYLVAKIMSSVAVHIVFQQALKVQNWTIISILLKISEKNKPNSFHVDLALHEAATVGNLAIVQEIMVIKGENQPTPASIYKAIDIAVKADNWDLVDIILRNTTCSLLPLLQEASTVANWRLIQHIINIAGADPLLKEAFTTVTFLAMESGIELDLTAIMRVHPQSIGARLGLSEAFTNFYAHYAVFSSRNRFADLSKRDEAGALPYPKLNLLLIDEVVKRNIFSLFASQTIHRYQSSACYWDNHCFSITLFKEDDKVHIIYANRGEKMEERGDREEENVMVYTLRNDIAPLFLERLERALSSKKRSIISKFFAHDIIKRSKNTKLIEEFRKSTQKVGNCTVANTNMTWYFALAAQYMEEHPKATLQEAYRAVKALYKKMRIKDRILAFQSLLQLSDEALRSDGVNQFLNKRKKLERPDYVKELFFSLTKEEIALLKSIKVDSSNAWIQLLRVTLKAQINQWDLIKNILSKMSLNGDEAPYILFVFQNAIEAHQWDIAQSIIAMKGDNASEVLLIKRFLSSILAKKIEEMTVRSIPLLERDRTSPALSTPLTVEKSVLSLFLFGAKPRANTRLRSVIDEVSNPASSIVVS